MNKSKQEFGEMFNIKLGTILTHRKLAQYVLSIYHLITFTDNYLSCIYQTRGMRIVEGGKVERKNPISRCSNFSAFRGCFITK